MSYLSSFPLLLDFTNIALFAILSSGISSWIYLIIVALHSHFCTPSIKKKYEGDDNNNNDKIILDNCSTSSLQQQFPPFVSIIIPARNEQENIEKCLLSLISQNYSNFEIVTVDDNSTDRTLSIMKSIELTACGRLKVVQLHDKPDGWTGKTWASQQGYLHSKGDILLFTDADTYYKSNDAIALAVMRMIQDKLDVLTGVPYLALPDTWSRIVMPVWNLYSEIFGRGIADVNNPKCKASAFVMGSFFMIRRHVFEQIGTYHNVKHEIQEDKAIGIILKRNQYKMKIFKIDEIVSALWSRDLTTLWHGIRRTLAPMVVENRSAALVQQAFLFFFMIIVPFALLPYVIILSSVILNRDGLESFTQLQYLQSLDDYHQISSITQFLAYPLSLLYINIFLCLLIMITTAVKGFSKYGLLPYYSIVSVIGASFLIVAYAYSIIPFLMRYNTQPISWRGRMHDPLVDCSGKRSLQEAQ